MKNTILMLLVLLSTLVYSQNIEELMQNYTNDYAAHHAKMYEKPPPPVEYTEEELERILFVSSIKLYFPDYVKIINVEEEWLENITSNIRENPSVLTPYLNGNTHDFSALLLIVHTFEIELSRADINDSDERVSFDAIMRRYTDEEYVQDVIENNPNINSKQDYFNSKWLRIKDSAINRIKDLINAQYPPEKHIIYPIQ